MPTKIGLWDTPATTKNKGKFIVFDKFPSVYRKPADKKFLGVTDHTCVSVVRPFLLSCWNRFRIGFTFQNNGPSCMEWKRPWLLLKALSNFIGSLIVVRIHAKLEEKHTFGKNLRELFFLRIRIVEIPLKVNVHSVKEAWQSFHSILPRLDGSSVKRLCQTHNLKQVTILGQDTVKQSKLILSTFTVITT